MTKTNNASCRKCRREGVKLYLKGARCGSAKCPITSSDGKNFPPGMRSRTGRRHKMSDYNVQLREKQKIKRLYGMRESQFKRLYFAAEKKSGITGDNLLESLERRLDNVVYRMNFAASRSQAKQLISHGHILVDGRKVTVGSFSVKINSVVSMKEKSKELSFVGVALKDKVSGPAHWIEVDENKVSGQLVSLPELQDVEIPMNMQLVIELYSK